MEDEGSLDCYSAGEEIVENGKGQKGGEQHPSEDGDEVVDLEGDATNNQDVEFTEEIINVEGKDKDSKDKKDGDSKEDKDDGDKSKKKKKLPSMEEDIGITTYAGDHKGFFGIIKQRYSDFQVNEVDSQGKIIAVTNQTIPDDPEEIPDMPECVPEMLDGTKLRELDRLLGKLKPKKEAEVKKEEGEEAEDKESNAKDQAKQEEEEEEEMEEEEEEEEEDGKQNATKEDGEKIKKEEEKVDGEKKEGDQDQEEVKEKEKKGPEIEQAKCKDKWHHLRSNFMRERRKNSEKPSGSGNTQTRRWVYYDAMQFLIPHVTPWPTSSNVPTPPDEDTCHETEDAAQDSSPSAVIEAPDYASPQKAASNIETCEDRSNGKPILPKSKKPCVTKKCSKTSADEMDMYFLDKLKQLREQASSQNDNDGDRQFLLSLLPMMKQLSPIDNMDIRIEIYEAFRRKMFKPAPSVQYGYWNEQNQSHTPTPSPSTAHASDNYVQYNEQYSNL